MVWLVVPPLIKSQGQKIASQQLGREVTIGAVAFNPFTLELTVRNVKVATADSSGTQLFVPRAYVNAGIRSLFELGAVASAVALDHPSLAITRLQSGALDIDDILQKLSQPAAPGTKKSKEPFPLALSDVALNGGAVNFIDRAVDQAYAVRDLDLRIPLVSSLEGQRDTAIHPTLAFKLDGVGVDASADSTPFAADRKTGAALRFKGLDLAPYLGYIPDSVPVQLRSAVLDADLKIDFAETKTPKQPLTLQISGTVAAHHVAVDGAEGKPLAALNSVQLDLAELQVFEQELVISNVTLDAPRIALRRNANGQIDLGLTTRNAAKDATKEIAASAQPAGAKGQKDTEKPTAQPWHVVIRKIALDHGQAVFTDQSTNPAAHAHLRDLQLAATDIVLPFEQPLQFDGSARIGGALPADRASPVAPITGKVVDGAASLQFNGKATDQMAAVDVKLSDMSLVMAQPYLSAVLGPNLSGSASLDGGIRWRAAAGNAKAQIDVDAKQLTLTDLVLKDGSQSLASITKVALTNTKVALPGQSVSVASVAVTGPKTRVERSADGRWMFEDWLRTSEAARAPGVSGAPDSPGQSTPAASPWSVSLGKFTLDGGDVTFSDKVPARPVQFTISKIQLGLQGATLAGTQPASVKLSADIEAGESGSGSLQYDGTIAWAPQLQTSGSVDVKRIPVAEFEPYFGASLNVDLKRAETSFKGKIDFAAAAASATGATAGPDAKIDGDLTVENLRATSVAAAAGGSTEGQASPPGDATAGEDLVNWKTLNLRGFKVALAPGAAPVVSVRQTALDDFFARIILYPDGKLNLQGLVKADAASAQKNLTATDSKDATQGNGAAAAPPAETQSAAAPKAVVDMGPVAVTGGRIFFTDLLIQPNYSANLQQLTGKLGAFSTRIPPSGQPDMATLELRGRTENSASLEIDGKLNPLAKPLALDITGKVTDLELPPFSPYSIKYAGYGIENGKLSLNVHYVVQPDGRIAAENQLTVNQLTFGEKDPNSPKSLPVKLAVALLADSNGVIDLNLPISGSLDNPQFSIWDVLGNTVGNLLSKAITAPFTLLARAFGGGGDSADGGTEDGSSLNQIPFPAGSAQLDQKAMKRLDKVAKALDAKPSLQLTIVGTANLAAEREAIKKRQLDQKLAAAQSGPAGSSGKNKEGADKPSADIHISAAERPDLLRKAFEASDIAKPRDADGQAKKLTPKEIESLLLAEIDVDAKSVRELARQRGVAVQDALGKDKVSAARLVLGDARVMAAIDVQKSESSSNGAKWSPHAELSLELK